MENFEIKNIFTGEVIPMDEIKAAIEKFFAYLFNFIKGEI